MNFFLIKLIDSNLHFIFRTGTRNSRNKPESRSVSTSRGLPVVADYHPAYQEISFRPNGGEPDLPKTKTGSNRIYGSNVLGGLGRRAMTQIDIVPPQNNNIARRNYLDLNNELKSKLRCSNRDLTQQRAAPSSGRPAIYETEYNLPINHQQHYISKRRDFIHGNHVSHRKQVQVIT